MLDLSSAYQNPSWDSSELQSRWSKDGFDQEMDGSHSKRNCNRIPTIRTAWLQSSWETYNVAAWETLQVKGKNKEATTKRREEDRFKGETKKTHCTWMAVRRASLTCCWDSLKATVPMPSIGKEEPLLSFTDLTILSSFSFSFSFSSPPPPPHHLWVEIVATAKYNSPQNHKSGSTQHPQKKLWGKKKSLKLKDQWWRKKLHHYYNNKLPTSLEYSQKTWKCSELEDKGGVSDWWLKELYFFTVVLC